MRQSTTVSDLLVFVAAGLVLVGLALGSSPPSATLAAGPRPTSTPTPARKIRSATAADGGYQIFLPLVVNGTGNGGLPPPTPTNTPVSGSPTGDFWLPFDTSSTQYPVVPTYGTNVAVDPSGGIHATYSVYSGFTDNNGTIPGFYAYCPVNCGSAANWTRVSLSDHVLDVRLQLTAAGHPRVMMYTTIANNPSLNQYDNIQYQYATCDAGCTNAASWTVTPVSPDGLQEIPANRSQYLHEYFRLDPQDNPVFVYGDGRLDQTHDGTFYRTCTTTCTDPNSWSEVQISSSAIYFPLSLAIAPSGQPRLVWANSANFDTTIGYMECDAANCLDPANWTTPLTLFDYGLLNGTADFSLQVNSSGNPRVVLYTGNNSNNPAIPVAQLDYLGCDSYCATNLDNNNNNTWFLQTVFSNGWGATPQLVLESSGLPHLSFDTLGSGPGYGWCTTSCQSASGSWQSEIVEPVSVLTLNYPVVPIYNCSNSGWSSGTRTSLALDANGNPRVGWDPQHFVSGNDLNHPGQQCPLINDINLARMAVANHP
jgi:hypothetical protein